jgi:hypothetical protein
MKPHMFLAIAALIGVVGLGAYMAGSGTLSATHVASRPARQTVIVNKPPRQTVIVNTRAGRGSAPMTPSAGAPVSAPSGSPASWPEGTSAYTIVLASVATPHDARTVATRARGLGRSVGVLNSSDYASLRPGYWVAFAGLFATEATARANLDAYRTAGFGDAYVRYVSDRATHGDTVPSAGGWPSSHSAYTVILASASTPAEADAVRRRADAHALPWTGVLHSDDFASLRPGYWVAFTGSYDTESEARSGVALARAAGFSDAYPRYVSATG